MQLTRRVCLVTGATSGIGRASAVELASRGAAVVAAARNVEALAAVEAETGGRTVQVDLSERGAPSRLAEEAGPVDVLVACAGVGLYGDVASLVPGELERMIDLNVTSTLELVAAVLPPMLERGSGQVVLVGSIAGRLGRCGEAAYAASKAAVACFADGLREELCGTGVGASLITPGVIDTAFFERRGAPYDRGWPRPIPAQRVALAVVSAIEGDRAEVMVPGWLSVAMRARGAAPGLYRALATRFG